MAYKHYSILTMLLLLFIIVCIIVLVYNKTTESFINSCTSAPVIKALTMPKTYKEGSNTIKNDKQNQHPSFIADSKFNTCLDIIYNESKTNNSLYDDNLNYFFKYAIGKGFFGKPSRQGEMNGCLNYCKLGIHYLFYIKRLPNYDFKKKEEIKKWLNKLFYMYAPTMSNRKNNQFVLFCLCGLINGRINNKTYKINKNDRNIKLNKKYNNSETYMDLLYKWIIHEFKDGYIESEKRGFRAVTYHYYTMNFVNSAFLIMKMAKIPFPFNDVKDRYREVKNRLTDINVTKKFADILNEPTMMPGPSNTSYLNDIYNYIYENGPIPKLNTLTVIEITPADLEVAVS